MRRGILVVGILALALGGCEDRRMKAIEKIDQDKEILGRVNAAVNEVIRNAPDCAVAKPLIPEAYQRIEEARGQVQAPASRPTLDALKAQVDRVADVCP